MSHRELIKFNPRGPNQTGWEDTEGHTGVVRWLEADVHEVDAVKQVAGEALGWTNVNERRECGCSLGHVAPEPDKDSRLVLLLVCDKHCKKVQHQLDRYIFKELEPEIPATVH